VIAYLDNAATTPLDPLVTAAMREVLESDTAFGNAASSTHAFGDEAAALIEAARGEVAAAVGAEVREVAFTSGATESNNLALFGVAQYYQQFGRHLITSRIEHKAVLDACRELERRGWSVSYLEPDRQGRIQSEQVARALKPETVLVSLMLVNNEIGVIQDVAAVGELCRAHGLARLHVDAAQAAGKLPLNFRGSKAHLMSLSAHKAYGPKGVGALLVSAQGDGTHLTPLQYGGGQERGLRSGTLATHQIVGMGRAFARINAVLAEDSARVERLASRLWQGIERLGGVERNGAGARVPHILNVSFAGLEGESLLASVSERIAVSTGSACTSASAEPSYVLRALGRDERASEASLRFGLGRFSSEADIDAAIEVLHQAVPRLRRIAGAI
jgi:cysteine desulfurase